MLSLVKEVLSPVLLQFERYNEAMSNYRHDQLTHVYNRYGLDYIIKEQFNHANMLYLLMIDIDNFKHINDTYGHEAGDDILIKVAGALNNRLGNKNVARIGGEEFIGLIPSNNKDIKDKLDDIMNNVRSIKIQNEIISISVGVSKMLSPNDFKEAKLEADRKAKELLVSSMQRYSNDVTSEQTVSTVELPNDEMKGRIIGREGRNIRTIEAVTGVDLIIDDTPEVIVLSSFDPLRREMAKVTLETLIKDGRIHPARIEELYDKVCEDYKKIIREKGEEALFELGLSKVDPEVVELIGKLAFRTSYGQDALAHSKEVAHLTGLMAAELGENVSLAKRAGLLHDIGKSIDFEVEGSHVEIGADIAKKHGEDKVVINAIESHHGDKKAEFVISELVAIADTLSAARPGARNDSLENYVKRLEELEHLGNEIEGVEKTFAMQAGRELRVVVKPDKVDDLTSYKIAREIKTKIEDTMQYPGTIKVVVIRETRAEEVAK